MKTLRNTLLAFALTLPLLVAAPAAAADDLSTFTLAGTVTNVWCLTGPEPPIQPCYVEVEVDVDNSGPAITGFWCRANLVDICEALPYGFRLIVVGKDSITEKWASHIGMLLESED